MRLSARSTTLHTACDTGHCRRTVAAARPEHVRFSRTAVSAQYSDTVSTAPTVQLCTNTVAVAGTVVLFARVTDTLVSKYGTVVDDVDPFVFSVDTCTVTTLDTSCGGGSGTFVELFDAALLFENRDADTSAVVTTIATVLPGNVDGACTVTVELLPGNEIAYALDVPFVEPFTGRNTATATLMPSAVTVVNEVPDAVVLRTVCSADDIALSTSVCTANDGLSVGRGVGARVAHRDTGDGCIVGWVVG